MTRVVCLALLLGAGCDLDRVVGLSSDPSRAMSVDRALRFTGRDRIDVLLMLDDSGSMSSKQAQLRAQLPQLLQSIVDGGAQRSVHFGVVTSDLGAPGIECGQNRGAHLQAIGAYAPATCKAPVGEPFLELTPTGSNLPTDQPLTDTIECMTAVGESGCGFEMPLEAVRLQLLERPDGESFLRDDSLLVVLFVTDEDDCSVPPTSDLFTNPAYGSLDSFRCTRHGILCNGVLVADAPAVYDDCRPATPSDGSLLTDLAAYQAMFGSTRDQGGVKDDPTDLVIAGLYAAPAPIYTQLSNDPTSCGNDPSCTILGHSCSSPSDPLLFGDPAVRLDSVVSGLSGLTRSICDTTYDAFGSSLQARIGAALGDACLSGALADPLHPVCTVTVGDVPLSSCAAGGAPCWTVEADPACPVQLDPTTGIGQQLHMRLVDAEASAATATCTVLVPR